MTLSISVLERIFFSKLFFCNTLLLDRVMFIIQRASKKQQMTINPFLSSWRIALNELNTMEDETKIRIKFRYNNNGKTQIHLLYICHFNRVKHQMFTYSTYQADTDDQSRTVHLSTRWIIHYYNQIVFKFVWNRFYNWDKLWLEHCKCKRTSAKHRYFYIIPVETSLFSK